MASRKPKSLEKTLLRLRVILWTWDEDARQLENARMGHVMLLEHRETAAVRLLVLEKKTLKVLANHPINASTMIKEHRAIDRECLWNCKYFADGEPQEETFLGQFNSTENRRNFKETVEKIARSDANKEGAPGDVDLVAASVEKLAAVENARMARSTMAEHVEEQPRSVIYEFVESVKEKFESSDSDNVNDHAVKAKIFRLFGRENPFHHVFGGGCSADVLLWRNKKISGGLLAGATAVWLLFEVLEYFLLALVCHALMVSFAMLFLWSTASTFINKTPPKIPEVLISEDLAKNIALSLRFEINRAVATLRAEIALGLDLRKFLTVIAGLWVLSIIGSCCSLLTLFYIVFVLLHTVPVLYEKYEDKIDPLAEKAWIEIKKQYAVFDAKVLSKVLAKIPKDALKDKKH